MSNSIQVKAWRKRFKQKLIDSFGGKCGICGYCKCNETLGFHHLDSTTKEFGLGGAMANPRKWETIVPELRKCVLLCSNCHSEIHAGVTTIPPNIIRFNEEFAVDYKPEQEMISCPICGIEIPSYKITCSLKCAAKKAWTVNWDDVDLEDLYVNKKITQVSIAAILGCSGSAVRKRLKKVGLL
jgi:hypothetical protein